MKKQWLVYFIAGFTIMFGLAARLAIGGIYSSAEAIQLLGSLSDAGLYLGSAIATASATTLALMLTLLGLTRRSDSEFDILVYHRISRVTLFATCALVGSVLLLLVLVMPMGEFEEIPNQWFFVLYDVVFGMLVFVSALLVTTVMQLFLTIQSVIAKLTPGEEV